MNRASPRPGRAALPPSRAEPRSEQRHEPRCEPRHELRHKLRHEPPHEPRCELWLRAPGDAPIRAALLSFATNGSLVGVHLEPPKGHLPKDVARSPGELPSPVRGQARRAADQLLAYLEGNLTRFSIRWTLPGDCTPFRKGVLETLSRIPFGEVLGYGELASRAGWAGAARAVGQVMATNPLPLVIPCHRVVAAGGGLGGFTGGIAIKRALLAHEGISLGE